MFATDQPRIESWAQCTPERTAHVIKFVLATVRCHFERVETRLEQFVRGDFTHATGCIRDGVEYVSANAHEIYAASHLNVQEAIEHYLQIPGIGIVKAGFVVQLLHGEAGCLDTHNLKMYGLHARSFQTPPTTGALRKRIKTYINVCESIGGSQVLWDNWCRYVATLRPHAWANAEHVSVAHYEIITRTGAYL